MSNGTVMTNCPLCGELVDKLLICPFTDADYCKACIESNEEHIGDFVDTEVWG